MSKALEPMMKELERESATTRRVLERIPENKLAWKPHAKSMSLGQLALHIAAVPGAIANLAKNDEFDLSQANFNQPAAANKAEIFVAFDVSVHWVETEARFPFRTLVKRFLNVGSYHILANAFRLGWHRDFTLHRLDGD